jgi:hypothetical protein
MGGNNGGQDTGDNPMALDGSESGDNVSSGSGNPGDNLEPRRGARQFSYCGLESYLFYLLLLWPPQGVYAVFDWED